MGDVAALHSECNDTKHTTQEDVNPPKSNLESLPGEASSESINTNDLQDKGYMEYGCQHYRRRCRIRAPCCNEIFDCRHCHNEAKNDINVDYKHRHEMPRHQVKQVICSLCATEQEVQPNCINCGVCMGKYFCETCKLFDDDISKQQYHCNGCGICRTGGHETFFHCNKCGCCFSTLLENSHTCVEGAMHRDCPVCFEYLFESTKEIVVMPCGHTIHKSCIDEMREHHRYTCPLCSKSFCDMSRVWERLDIEIAATPMPEQYQNKMKMDKFIEEFEELSADAARVQRVTLKRILEDNALAEYLQNLGLNGRIDPESFKSCVPLVTHKDLEPYINRIIDGDASPILTTKPVTAMSLSSGTTQGKPKYVPWNDELFETSVQIHQTSFAYMSREFPLMKNGKALHFIYGSKQFKTRGGLVATTITGNMFRNPCYTHAVKELKIQYCSPDEVVFCPDFFQSLYCHLLSGLIYCEDVQSVSSPFAHNIVQAFRTFEQVWEELCGDIREGVLTSRIMVPSIRMAMSKLLKPNPELANIIHKKCIGMNNWYGLIPELFPNAKYIFGIMSGSMEPYIGKLRHYAGELPLVTSIYGASEGFIAANVNPKLPPDLATYAVFPQNGYFEFIPLTQLSNEGTFLCADPRPVGLTEVKVGKEYEIVVTNSAGLYRYRLGDVVKVMGFHNSTPKLKFIRRSGILLSINIDKNTEKDLQIAVEASSKLLAEEKLEVVEFTSHVDLSKEPGHYVIFWEINGEASEEVLIECCNCLDKSFIDAGYISSRKFNTIGALELRVVRKGTFQKILDHYLGLGTSVSQYKTPRCVGPAHNIVLQLLNENVVKNHLSTAFN